MGTAEAQSMPDARTGDDPSMSNEDQEVVSVQFTTDGKAHVNITPGHTFDSFAEGTERRQPEHVDRWARQKANRFGSE
jgi:hypothetical protein